jgi:hypothetical protein
VRDLGGRFGGRPAARPSTSITPIGLKVVGLPGSPIARPYPVPDLFPACSGGVPRGNGLVCGGLWV